MVKALVSFYSLSGHTQKVAEKIVEGLEEKGVNVLLQKIETTRSGKLRKKGAKLKKSVLDWKGFDLVFVGTPTRGGRPSRAIRAYLKECINIEGKKVGLFVTCIGMPGKTIKKMSGMVSSRGGEVVGSLVLRTLLGLGEKKLVKAKEFSRDFLKKV